MIEYQWLIFSSLAFVAGAYAGMQYQRRANLELLELKIRRENQDALNEALEEQRRVCDNENRSFRTFRREEADRLRNLELKLDQFRYSLQGESDKLFERQRQFVDFCDEWHSYAIHYHDEIIDYSDRICALIEKRARKAVSAANRQAKPKADAFANSQLRLSKRINSITKHYRNEKPRQAPEFELRKTSNR